MLKNPLTSREKSDLKPKVFKAHNHRVRIPSYRFSVGSFSKGCLSIPPYNFNPQLQQTRANLPIAAFRNEVLNAIEHNQIMVIVGETGSGKTTQIPQYILENCSENNRPCRIFCTQPRRLSALSVADRVVQERGEIIGTTVGYQIRLESRTSPTSNLIYSTVGVFLRCLMSETQDAFFSSMTHIIVDEVHERDKYTDFLLTTLKRAILRYPHLRLILMSATIESESFSNYFFDCPSLKIAGRMFDVKTFFLEDILVILDRESSSANKDITENENCNTSVDSETAEVLNETLHNCACDPLNNFPQMFYLVEGENLPVDYRHSETDMTALMIAACQGNLETINRLLSLGANPELKSKHGLNSIDWATKMRKNDCVALLSGYVREAIVDPSHAHLLLSRYQKQNSDDVIDRKLIYNIIKYVHKNEPQGSILVFLPGYDDIIELNDIISRGIAEQDMDSLILMYMLHSSMSTNDQKNVFKAAPEGYRKVILSTNISETSVTINDVVYVIDAGKVKQKGFDSMSGSSSLSSTWISRACATQRSGRAGRTQPGKCYRIFTKYRYESLEKFTIPEILRIPLTDICLQAKLIAQNIPIAEFLRECIQPPTELAIKQSIKILQSVGGLDEYENLTELGAQLVDLPVDVQLGKILIYSIIFRCLDPVLTIVSALSVKDPFILPSVGSERNRAFEIKKEFSDESYSDHMAMLKMFQKWLNKKATKKDKVFCRESFLSSGNMETMCGVRSQILGYLRAVGLVQSQGPGNIHDANRNSQNWPTVKACLVAGLYPNVCRLDQRKGILTSKYDSKILIHKSSVVHNNTKTKFNSRDIPTDWIIYGEKIRIGSMGYIRTNTVVTPLTIALFGGPLNQNESDVLTSFQQDESWSDTEDNELANNCSQWTRYQLDDWICFSLPTETAYMVYNLRQKMNALVLKFINNPRNYAKTELDSNIIVAITEILSLEDIHHNLSQPTGIGERPKAVVHNYMNSTQFDQHFSNASNNFAQNRFSNGPSSSKYFNQRYSKLQNRPITNNNYNSNMKKIRQTHTETEPALTIRYFIVKGASRAQIMNIFGTDKWDFSSSTLKNIFKISRVSSFYLFYHYVTP